MNSVVYKEPDWSDSKTFQSELRKNPTTPMNERLQIADGAIHYRDNIIENLRKQVEYFSKVCQDCHGIGSYTGQNDGYDDDYCGSCNGVGRVSRETLQGNKHDKIIKALKQAYSLGQVYWQQADSEYSSQWKEADATEAKFDKLVEEIEQLLKES